MADTDFCIRSTASRPKPSMQVFIMMNWRKYSPLDNVTFFVTLFF